MDVVPNKDGDDVDYVVWRTLQTVAVTSSIRLCFIAASVLELSRFIYVLGL